MERKQGRKVGTLQKYKEILKAFTEFQSLNLTVFELMPYLPNDGGNHCLIWKEKADNLHKSIRSVILNSMTSLLRLIISIGTHIIGMHSRGRWILA